MRIGGIVLIVIAGILLFTAAENYAKARRLGSDPVRREFKKDAIWGAVVPAILLGVGIWMLAK